MVLAVSDGVSPAPPYSGSRLDRTADVYGTFTPCGPAFQKCSTWHSCRYRRSYNPAEALTSTVWAVPFSLATTQGIAVAFSSSGYLDVSVPRVCPPDRSGMVPLHGTGLPHSEICGSHRICRSPQLIAAYHVLLRL